MRNLPEETGRMARVEVTEHELKTGSFPPVCAKTGEETTNLVEMEVPFPPRWLRHVSRFLRPSRFGRTVVAQVPLSQPIIELRKRQHADLIAAGAGGTLAAIVGLFIPIDGIQVALVAVGLILAAGAQFVLAGWRRDSRIKFIPTSFDTVVMDRVHPQFRDALAAGGPRLTAPTPEQLEAMAERKQHPDPDPWRGTPRSA